MPHQCVKCGAFYEDESDEILKGCSCGGKLFFFVKSGRGSAAKERFSLSPAERAQIEEDVYDLIGDEIDRERPVILDLESVRVRKPGKYELDLVHLFESKQPLVYKLEDGKYVVDLIETFNRVGR